MIELPRDQKNPLVVGVGRHRACYIHPADSSKCIKVVHNPGERASREIERELAYYRRLEAYLQDWSSLPRYYGEVQTNLGTGYVYDRIVDFDGKPSQSIQERYGEDNLDTLHGELIQLIEKLRIYLWNNRIVTMSIKPYNILCHRISDSEIIPVVCDNIGSASFWPIEYVCPWFCHQKQKRQFRRLMESPLMQKVMQLQK